jgi:hypothetical protein
MQIPAEINKKPNKEYKYAIDSSIYEYLSLLGPPYSDLQSNPTLLQLLYLLTEQKQILKIMSFIEQINKDNINDILKRMCMSINKYFYENFYYFILIIFSYICNTEYCYITDETILKILTHIVYFFVNQNMQIPAEINKKPNKEYKEAIDSSIYGYLSLLKPPYSDLKSNPTLLQLLYLLTKQKEFLKKKVNNSTYSNSTFYN